MFNLFRMDVRRLVRSKGFYIMLALTVLWLSGVILMMALISDLDFLAWMESNGGNIDGYDYQLREELLGMNQLEFAHEWLRSGFLLIMTGIGVTLFVHSDFSSGYVKNICFARRRWEYVLSKVLLVGVYSGAIVVVGILVSLIFPPLLGLHLGAVSVVDILQYALWLWFPHWAFGLMGLALVLLTRGSTLGIVLAVISGGGVIATMLQYVCLLLGLPLISRYFLSSVVGEQCIPWPGSSQMTMILACTAGWAVLYGVVSLFTMKKRDI